MHQELYLVLRIQKWKSDILDTVAKAWSFEELTIVPHDWEYRAPVGEWQRIRPEK